MQQSAMAEVSQASNRDDHHKTRTVGIHSFAVISVFILITNVGVATVWWTFIHDLYLNVACEKIFLSVCKFHIYSFKSYN